MMTMFKTELRQLWPIAALWLALDLLYSVNLLFTTRIDETGYVDLCDTFCEPGLSTSSIAVLTALLILIGWSLFPRDSDNGTLEHLKSLALSRGQIFSAKVLAGFSLVAILFTFSVVLSYLFVATNPQSLHGKFYGYVEWQQWLRFTLYGCIVISHCVFLSSFRLVGLVLYAAYFVFVGWIESQYANVAAWNPFNVLRVDFYGSELITDWRLFAIHGAVALLFLLLGYWRWMARSSNSMFDRVRLDSPWLTIPAFGVLFLGLLGVMVFQSNQIVAQRNANLAIIETDQYRFVHTENSTLFAEELAARADDMVLEIAAYLNTEPPPKIQVDLTSNTSHIAGLAVHNRIRMRLNQIPQDIENRFVLKKASSSVGFFVEGMAQQIAFTIEPDPKRRKINWLVGAIAAERQEIKFRDMVDAPKFAERFDAELPYTLGDLWTNTMAEVCGDESMGDFLRIIAADDAVLSLSGVSFWRQHLQRLPCELEDINFRFGERIKTLANSDEAMQVPETRSVIVRADENDADTVLLTVNV